MALLDFRVICLDNIVIFVVEVIFGYAELGHLYLRVTQSSVRDSGVTQSAKKGGKDFYVPFNSSSHIAMR